MNDTMKSNLQLGLLVVIAATVIYGTFLKEDPLPARRGNDVAATPASSMAAPAQATNLNNPLDLQAQQPEQPQTPQRPPTQVAFAAMNHDFGNINQDTENEHIFEFTNTGTNPLIIESATGSCGCTVPEYPKEPIPPGKKGEIKVVYKPGKQKGNQTKTVTIVANTEPRETRLNITAQVEEVNS